MNEKQNLDKLIQVYLLMDNSDSSGINLNQGFKASAEQAGHIEAKKVFTSEAFRLLKPFLNKGSGITANRNIIDYRLVLVYKPSVEEYMEEISSHVYYKEQEKKWRKSWYRDSQFHEGVP